MTQDEKFMRRAIELAKKGNGSVSPNPLVGAVIVKNGKIIAQGWHKYFGGDHAEIVALNAARKAGSNLSGSVLYVNLEPCVHYGKTPPCVGRVIASGIKRVVIAMKDPNPLVNGRGITALKKAGIKVSIGCLKSEARLLRRPFVAMKVAMSLDGKIATRTGDSKWITSEKSRKYVHEIRNNYDAILVGSKTVVKDNPVLAGTQNEPKRIILDSYLKVSLDSKVFRNANVFVATTKKAPIKKIKILEKRGINFKIFNPTKSEPDKIPLIPLLDFLAGNGVSSILVEGGGEIFNSFINENLVNKFYWFIAPKIIGNAEKMSQALSVNNYTFKNLSGDLLFEVDICEQKT